MPVLSTSRGAAGGLPPSLTEAQADEVAVALADFPGEWSLERQESYDGTLVLLVVPERETAATFVLDGAEGGVCLSVLRDDALQECGRFETMAAAVATLRDLTDAEANGPAGWRAS